MKNKSIYFLFYLQNVSLSGFPQHGAGGGGGSSRSGVVKAAADDGVNVTRWMEAEGAERSEFS